MHISCRQFSVTNQILLFLKMHNCACLVVAASLAIYTATSASAAESRSSVHITCDNNLAFDPPPGVFFYFLFGDEKMWGVGFVIGLHPSSDVSMWGLRGCYTCLSVDWS